MPLFDAQQLGAFLQTDVAPGTAAQVEQVVWGWLQPVLQLDRRPEPPPSPQLYAWALELGAIAHENPTGLSVYQLGQEQWGYSSERRKQILEEARASTGSLSTLAPTGSFPDAASWPDPIPTTWSGFGGTL